MYCELRDVGLISVRGPDAGSFLHAQLTSDVLGIEGERIQWSGYCSPKGRLLATLLLWKTADAFLLQLPARLTERVRTRLARYVLRSRVTLEDASPRSRLYGLVGQDAQSAAATLAGAIPSMEHGIVSRGDVTVARVSPHRCILITSAAEPPALQSLPAGQLVSEEHWARLDIEDGVPWVTPETEDAFVPQMVNLDLLGGVSFSKGCYPGQEIVARMHYLGRLKQRMYRIRVPASGAPRAGDSLYSPRFGAEQACGTLLDVASRADESHEALAVIQIESARDGNVHLGDLPGPTVDFLPLPYPVPH